MHYAQLMQLLEHQRKLSKKIREKNNITHGPLASRSFLLAFRVELGEILNEKPFFKIWSDQKKPNSLKEEEKWTEILSKKGIGVDIELILKERKRDHLLEELADGLSFILELTLENNVDAIIERRGEIYTRETLFFKEDINFIAIRLFDQHMSNYSEIIEALGLYIAFTQKLGYTLGQLITAYYEKNEINHQRQESGY